MEISKIPWRIVRLSQGRGRGKKMFWKWVRRYQIVHKKEKLCLHGFSVLPSLPQPFSLDIIPNCTSFLNHFPSGLYILVQSILQDVPFTNIFSQAGAYLFVLLRVSFEEHKSFIFGEVQFISLLFSFVLKILQLCCVACGILILWPRIELES